MEIKCSIAYRMDWENRNEHIDVVLTEEQILMLAGEGLKQTYSSPELIHIDIENCSIENVSL